MPPAAATARAAEVLAPTRALRGRGGARGSGDGARGAHAGHVHCGLEGAVGQGAQLPGGDAVPWKEEWEEWEEVETVSADWWKCFDFGILMIIDFLSVCRNDTCNSW